MCLLRENDWALVGNPRRPWGPSKHFGEGFRGEAFVCKGLAPRSTGAIKRNDPFGPQRFPVKHPGASRVEQYSLFGSAFREGEREREGALGSKASSLSHKTPSSPVVLRHQSSSSSTTCHVVGSLSTALSTASSSARCVAMLARPLTLRPCDCWKVETAAWVALP